MKPPVFGLPRLVARITLCLFAFALLFYSVAWSRAPLMGGDASQYIEVARDLVDFRMDAFHDRPIGYPILLLLTGSTEGPTRALFVVSIVLHLVAVWLLMVALHRLHVDPVPLVGFGVLLVLPPYVEWAAYVLTENLAEFTLVVTVVGLLFWYMHGRIGWLILAGLSSGWAAIVKPTYEALAIAVVALLLGFVALRIGSGESRRIARACAVFLGVAGSIVLVYSYWNLQRFGYFGVSPLLGEALSTKTVRVLERLPKEYSTVRDELVRVRDLSLIKPGSSHTGSQYIFAARPELGRLTGLDRPALARYMVAFNVSLIRAAPLSYVGEVLAAFGPYWGPGTRGVASFDRRSLQLLWALMHFALLAAAAIPLLIIVGNSLLRAFAFAARSRTSSSSPRPLLTNAEGLAYSLSLMIVIYTMFLSCALNVGDPRHRAPTDALMIFSAVVGAYAVARRVSGDSQLAATDAPLRQEL